MFEQGDLKYVILQLLEEKPRHGYEVIKELEERFGGMYSPSAGTVYPTLTLLEDMGYASVSLEEGGKKIYSITPEGKAYLEQNKSAVDDIFERIADFGASFLSDSMMRVNRAFKEVGRATYTTAPRHMRDRDLIGKIADILDRAAKEIEDLGKK
jgi:DNA-binding PadR family transcriptional regulator